MSGAPTRCSLAAVNILATAGALLWVFSASSSAHCSTKTKVSPDWFTEYSWQPGSACTSSAAVVRMSRTVSTDSGLTVSVATTTTGMRASWKMSDGFHPTEAFSPLNRRLDGHGQVTSVADGADGVLTIRLAAWLARLSRAPEPERAGQRALRGGRLRLRAGPPGVATIRW